MSKESLVNLIESIRTAVEGQGTQRCTSLLPYLVPDSMVEQSMSLSEVSGFTDEDIQWLRQLFSETNDILKHDDFSFVLLQTLNQGFDILFTQLCAVFRTNDTRKPQNHASVEEVVPLVKLIPPIAGSIHLICTDTAEKYFQELFKLPCLNDFGKYIYTAFSQTAT